MSISSTSASLDSNSPQFQAILALLSSKARYGSLRIGFPSHPTVSPAIDRHSFLTVLRFRSLPFPWLSYLSPICANWLSIPHYSPLSLRGAAQNSTASSLISTSCWLFCIVGRIQSRNLALPLFIDSWPAWSTPPTKGFSYWGPTFLLTNWRFSIAISCFICRDCRSFPSALSMTQPILTSYGPAVLDLSWSC